MRPRIFLLCLTFIVLLISILSASAYTGSIDFRELFKYNEDQKNANLETALLSISRSFNANSFPVTQELLAAIIATLEQEVEVHNFLPKEEIGDYGMGPGSTYTVKGSHRSTPYEGGVDYKGRGYIQLTLKDNYQEYCGADCVGASEPQLDICGCKNQKYCTVTDATKCPQVNALQPDRAAKIFALFYIRNHLVSLSNAGSYMAVSNAIHPNDEAYASTFTAKANTYLTLFRNNPDKAKKLLTWLNSVPRAVGARMPKVGDQVIIVTSQSNVNYMQVQGQITDIGDGLICLKCTDLSRSDKSPYDICVGTVSIVSMSWV